MIRVILTSILLAILAVPSWGISEGGAVFLMIRPGARASGMGSAFCAVADDATATYFNPAGLAFLAKETEVLLTTSQVRDWRRLAEGLQGTEEDYLLDAADILDPEGVAIRAAAWPLFCQADIDDWAGLLKDLMSPEGTRPSGASLLDRIDEALRDSLKGLDPQNLSPGQRSWVLHGLNSLLYHRDLYQISKLSQTNIPEAVWEALDQSIYREAKNSVKPEEIVEPQALAQRLLAAKDPASQQMARLMSPRTKGLLERWERMASDSLRKVLSAELTRAVRAGAIYRPVWAEAYRLKPITKQLASLSLKGDELWRFNLRLLADAFPSEIEYRFDREGLGLREVLILNRSYLEALWGSRVRAWADRAEAGEDIQKIYSRLKGTAEEMLAAYDHRQGLSPEQTKRLADEINWLIADKDLEPNLPAGANRFQTNRGLLDKAFPAEILPLSGQRPRSAGLYLRQRLPENAQAVLEGMANAREIDEPDKSTLVEGLNTLILAEDLYQPAYFPKAMLGAEARSLASAGQGLSGEKRQRLNRLLLESVLSEALAKVGAEARSRYATLMHSPWLSEIWGDVGDMYYEFIAYAQPVKDWGVFGGNVIFLSEGKSQHIDDLGNVLGEFSSYEFSPTLSYGNKVLPGLGAGVNLKVIHSHLAPFGTTGQKGKGVATTWAVDLGLLYHLPWVNRLTVGANLQNLGPKLVYIDAAQADPLSRNLRLGLAYRILDGRLTRLTTALDITRTVVDFEPSWSQEWWKEQWEEVVKHFGLEYWYLGPVQLALRYGLVYDKAGNIGSVDDKFNLAEASTFGGSVGYRRISFDFALEPGGELMNRTKQKKFALSYNF